MDQQSRKGLVTLQGRGGEMPALGFGTWALTGKACRCAIKEALHIGYRHIDTAEIYGNEEEIGEGIQHARIDRDSVFLVTKVWHTKLDAKSVKKTLHASLSRLQTDYVDLMLIHWPNKNVPLAETLGAMAELQKAGKVRHIGVSNFTVALLEAAQQCSPTPIFCNQVEYHPYLSQEPVISYCQANNILLVAYCPLARGRVFQDPVLREIGNKHGKTGGQVALRWLLQQEGVGAMPRSGSSSHIQDNFNILDFQLTEEEMKHIFQLQEGARIVDSGIPTPSWDT